MIEIPDKAKITPARLLAVGFVEESDLSSISTFWYEIEGRFIRFILNGKTTDWSLCYDGVIDGIPAPLFPRNMDDVQWLIDRCRSVWLG